MARYVLKLDKEHDAYVLFSTVVDGVASDVLTKDQMFEEIKRESPQADELIWARLVRAEISGSSAKDGDYSWDDGSILFLDGGASNVMVPRDQLYSHVVQGRNDR